MTGDNAQVLHNGVDTEMFNTSIIKSEKVSEGIYESEVGLNSKKSYKDLFKVISSYTQIISFKEKIPMLEQHREVSGRLLTVDLTGNQFLMIKKFTQLELLQLLHLIQ